MRNEREKMKLVHVCTHVNHSLVISSENARHLSWESIHSGSTASRWKGGARLHVE